MELEELTEYVKGLDYLTEIYPVVEVADDETQLFYLVTETKEIYDFPSASERQEYINHMVVKQNYVSSKIKYIEEKTSKKTGEVIQPESYRLILVMSH